MLFLSFGKAFHAESPSKKKTSDPAIMARQTFTPTTPTRVTFTPAAFPDTKPHYEILDGLRGVAALLVVWYHVFEGYSFASGDPIITCINHGYLAVDFFFILSGFVISYAYDDRWKAAGEKRRLTVGQFFKRRLIRLHPMVVLCAVVGAVTFFIQGSVQWDGTHVATSSTMLALLLTMFMIPAVPGCSHEVRGNGEMFPLNGTNWSLFFEYVGNILYALMIRRFSKAVLAVFTAVLGLLLAWFAITDVSDYGSLGVGWTLDRMNFLGGMLRMLFPFSMGMLVARGFRPVKIRGAFLICSIILAALLFVPYIETAFTLGDLKITMNGIYETACIAIAFPLLVRLGASGITKPGLSGRICGFVGELSFPLYAVHYPFMYLFYAHLIRTEQYTFAETWPLAIAVYVWCIIAAYLCLRFYDKPVRKWLSGKLA